MSPGERAPQHHAESQANNVSSNALLSGHGQNGANGVDATVSSINHSTAEAGPSQPRSVGSNGGSASAQQRSNTPKVPTKRRRIDAELAFSSPGPAFQLQLQQQESQAQEESDRASGRARRPRPSATLLNSNSNSNSNNSQSRPWPPSGATRQESSGEATASSSSSSLSSSSNLNSNKANSRNETARDQSRSASTSSDLPNLQQRSRSRSRSAVKLEADPLSLAQVEDAEADQCPPTVRSSRARPEITSLAQFATEAPLSEILDRRKKEKVAVAQSDLEQVHDGHDMLVRELFHLTKFVTMVGYDPHLARNDQSDVFTTFKHQHDLRFSLDQSVSGASISTPARITRNRVNARLESLSLKRPQPPSNPSTPASTTNAANTSRGPENDRSTRSSSIVDSKSRSNMPADSQSEAGDEDEDDGSDAESAGSDQDTSMRPARGKRKGKAREERLHSTGKQAPSSTAKSSKRQRSLVEEISSDASAKPAGPRKSKARDQLDAFIIRHRPRPLPDHVPPLHILSPLQLPSLRRFGGNLDALLQSFHLLHDGQGSWEAVGSEDAHLQTYMKLDQRWRSGLPLHPQAGSTTRHVAHKAPRTKSHQDHLLEAVAGSYPQIRQFARHKQQNARKVARIVAQHWERQLGTSEREKKAEERRIRALAKWTLREVLKQWRLAVNIVRARKAAAEKAEKEKMDKEQLNAILEQSTAMLKKQHQVMTRANSVVDSNDEASDRTSFGSNASVEPDGSGVEEEAAEADQASDAEIGLSETEEVDTIRQISSPIKRDRSITATPAPSTPATVDTDDQMPSTPALQDADASVNRDSSVQAASSPRRSRPGARGAVEQTYKAKNSKPDADDVEFDADVDDGEQEDAELERQMWEEDEQDDSEDAGLEADANIPIEELLKRYGYGQDAEREAEEEDDAESKAPPKEDDQDQPATPKMEEMEVDGDASMKGEMLGEEPDEEELDEEMTEDAPSSKTLVRPADALLDEVHSDTESAVTSGRRSTSRRSMTRASSIVSSDRQAARYRQPFLLRGQLRPYQQIGFEWLSSLYANGVNGILADEMGLGKTIQTISLLAHLACDKGVWGPHLVVAPTSVMLNWEVEFKKFLPGFKILSYYGNQKERKEKRIGWNTENSFNVCITSYQIVLADQHIFRRKPWVYLVLDEAHHIKNFRSQRWQTLLGFNSQRRLLLTGTPLQNNLMDLWSLMYFLMPHGVTDLPGGGAFANMKDFQDWFSNPLDKAIEGGTSMNEETRAMVQKLHAVLRPYLLRRLKSEVEKELPSKYEHVITCRLSKRQRFLYNDFMSRAKTRESLASGNYLSIINCLMQLRKVCNHPDLFEVRPIVTSFAMSRSVVADYEIKDLLVRRQLVQEDIWDKVNLDVTNFRITNGEEHLTAIESRDLRRLNASKKLPHFRSKLPDPPELDTWTIDNFIQTREQRRLVGQMEKWKHLAYINQYRCTKRPIFGSGLIRILLEAGKSCRLEPLEQHESDRKGYLNRCDSLLRIVQSRLTRRENMQPFIDRFAFVTPRAVAVDMPRYALPGFEPYQCPEVLEPEFDTVHPVAVKLHIAFPDASLLQYDCGKLQQLDLLMRRLKEGGHRILIFTQMTRVLDILESFLNYHGYRYLRLDGATKVEQRQALTEKFNRDLRISAFILSTRSGGLGINLTGADTVLFYDLDWNAAIEAQCMDRAHRIGQTRDVHIYRFVTEHTIEENMLRKANQKRLLDNVVIQEGEFNTETLAKRIDWRDMLDDANTLAGVEVNVRDEGQGGDGVSGREVEKAFLEAEDEEDRVAAVRVREEEMVGDEGDFNEQQQQQQGGGERREMEGTSAVGDPSNVANGEEGGEEVEGDGDGEEEGGTIDDYMLAFVERDWELFA
ncbi:related to SWR1-DEAH-box protein, putative RNA helicase [Ustilago bromivora]|uniref:Helicase SWR1 n=1 Tax=Ustilago bromivora TaxID=307758 RepID=A0A1K0GD07_9BASI|nr:related to SWR1-DEAH-box protein, putative RNA helicase [Ustilago bromivora]SYW80519.1 related to SWR1 - DEAH-box protein, putative RNA helicase [Ustilago bromivora]